MKDKNQIKKCETYFLLKEWKKKIIVSNFKGPETKDE